MTDLMQIKAMYLNKQKIHALELALEAMENSGVYSDEANDAINAIVEIINAARSEQQRRKLKEKRKVEVVK